MIFDAYLDNKHYQVKIVEDKNGYLVAIDTEGAFHIDVSDKLAGGYSLLYKSRSYEFDVESKDTHYTVISRGNLYSVDLFDQKSTLARSKETLEKNIVAKMPGKIIKVLTKVGDQVTKGHGCFIMEAMKMENELKAPQNGKVTHIKVKEGQIVEAGALLLLID